MRVLDSFGTALREYEFVSAEPSSSAVTTDAAARLKATGLDVRGFPWIRPLAGDYVYNFKQVEGLYAGNPMEPEAWREAVRRAQQKSRDRADDRLGPPGAAGAAARLAGGPGRGRATGRRIVGRRRHGPAGGSLRRTALHAAQGAHGAPARAPHRARSRGPGRRPVLGRGRGSRLGGDRKLYGARRRVPAAHRDAGGSRGSRRAADRAAHAGRRRRADHRRTGRRPPADRIHRPDHRQPSRRLEARDGHGARVRDVDRNAARTARPGGLRVGGRGREAAGRGGLRERARGAGTHRDAGRRGGRSAGGARPRAPGRAAARQRLALPAERRADVDQEAGRSARDRRHDVFERGAGARSGRASGPVQPERAAPADRAGHALPHHLLRRRPERAGLPGAAGQGLRGVRRADAADVLAHHRDPARLGRDALCREVRGAVSRPAHAGRVCA